MRLVRRVLRTRCCLPIARARRYIAACDEDSSIIQHGCLVRIHGTRRFSVAAKLPRGS